MYRIVLQHDILWGSLTAEEHLFCYGRLRGLTGDILKDAVQEQLRLLGLTGVLRVMIKMTRLTSLLL